jgi:hypothetical protein
MDAWDDKNFVAAIEKSGRKKIVLAGLWHASSTRRCSRKASHDDKRKTARRATGGSLC